MRLRICLVLVVVLITVIGATPAAGAATVTCGMNVSSDVTFTQDLTCTGPGLIIASDGVTIDLNGHTLTGSSVSTGIEVGRFSATIKDGAIEYFAKGIAAFLSGSPATSGTTVVERVHLSGNGVAVDGLGASLVIVDSALTGNGGGVNLYDGYVSIDRSDLSHNGGAVGFSGSSTGDIRNSTFVGNGGAVTASQVGGVTITKSKLIDNSFGISVFQGGHWTITGNTIAGSDIGVLIESFDNDGTVLARNHISGNRIGVQLGDEVHGHLSGDDFVVSKNVFRDNGAAGLSVAVFVGSATNMVIDGNTFIGNGFSPQGTTDLNGHLVDDGLHIVGSSTVLADILVASNKANRNADYGIEADGVTDGGRNKAKANGNPAECLGVSC